MSAAGHAGMDGAIGDGGVAGVAGCPMCAGPPVPGHNFCEACGRDLRLGAGGGGVDGGGAGGGGGAASGADGAASGAGRAGAADVTWRSSTAPAGPCASCGGTALSAEGYCEECGHRRRVGQDHVELQVDAVCAVTDKGRHKRRNEDAVAVGRVGDIAVAVVSDGVSSSDRADEAAHASVDAGIATLLAELKAGAPPARATVAATRAAAAAVAALAGPDNAHSPPSCTYVSAVVAAGEVVIGWVGDSRAYWLGEPPAESRLLSTDDSLAGQLAAAGVPASAADRSDPRLRALARWLGADAGDTEPHLATWHPTGAGRVLLCSDGLSRYLSEPAELARAVSGTPAETARALNQLSLEAGGVDNIAIVIMPVPSPEESQP